MPPKAVPGRLALLVTLFLVQMEMVKDVQNILPNSDSLTGMSAFALVSLFFIFIAFIEYALVLLVARLKECYNLNIKWNSETVDFFSMIFYLLGMIIFVTSYISIYI